MADAPRLLFHVQHLLGVGHRNRAWRIAEACRQQGFAVEMTVGEEEPVQPGIEPLRLPTIRSADAGFSALVDAAGEPVGAALWDERARRLTAAVGTRPPGLLLVEGYPFARRKFEDEIEPLIAAARAAGAAIVCSLRDILVAKPDPGRNAATAFKAAGLYDRILVHGDPEFVPLSTSFPPAESIAERLAYTGYVAPAQGPRPAGQTPGPRGADAPILVSVGGGAVGARLLEAALDAREGGVEADRPWRLLGGPNLEAAARGPLEQRAEALPGVTLEPALDGPAFRAALAEAALSVSQAGYNTVVDLWMTRPRAVLVPFQGPTGKESEQPLRAELLAVRGEAVVCPEAGLDGAALGAAIREALSMPDPADPAGEAAPPPDLGGAPESARQLAALAGQPGLG
jgi:predicted glycosyltransferase